MSTGSGTGTPVTPAADPAALVPGLLYASLAELVYDLDLPGVAKRHEAKQMDRIRAASEWLTHNVGRFVPVTETRRYDGPGGKILFVDMLLAVTSIVNDTTTLAATDYVLYPRSRHWINGPYTRIEIDPDAASLGAWSTERDDIAITGRWGKYEETVTTGATVANATQISDSATALQVNDGSKVSPGMVLLIGTEQMTVEETGSPTTATSLVNGAVTADSDQLVVDNGAEFNVGEVLQIGTEDVRIETINTHTLAVTRKWNETNAAAIANDAAIKVYRTYTVKRGVNGTAAASHANGVAISRYVAPWDVNWLARQIAGLMHKKAKGGFSTRSGSAEMGDIAYHHEFPKDVIAQIARKYRLTGI